MIQRHGQYFLWKKFVESTGIKLNCFVTRFDEMLSSECHRMLNVEITEFYWHDSVAKFPSNYLLAKELYSKLIWRKKLLFQSVWFHEKNSNFIDMIQSQNFRQITFWLKNFTLSWFDEKKLLFKQCVISRKKNHQIDFLFTKCFSTYGFKFSDIQ